MTTGQRIKFMRTNLGLTQEELAKKCGYKSKSTINKIEKSINGVSMDTVASIAKALDCEPSYLMGWEVANENKLSREKAFSDIDLIVRYSMLNNDNKKIISTTINAMIDIQNNH